MPITEALGNVEEYQGEDAIKIKFTPLQLINKISLLFLDSLNT